MGCIVEYMISLTFYFIRSSRIFLLLFNQPIMRQQDNACNHAGARPQ